MVQSYRTEMTDFAAHASDPTLAAALREMVYAPDDVVRVCKPIIVGVAEKATRHESRQVVSLREYAARRSA